MKKWLKDCNTNILIAKWILVKTIMWEFRSTNTLRNMNSIVIKEDHLQRHPFQCWEPMTLNIGLHMYKRQRISHMIFLFTNNVKFILRRKNIRSHPQRRNPLFHSLPPLHQCLHISRLKQSTFIECLGQLTQTPWFAGSGGLSMMGVRSCPFYVAVFCAWGVPPPLC
jgi:hypothetical protein